MYPNLRAAMAAKRVSIEASASLLGIHRNTFTNRLNGDSSFTIEEALKLKSDLFPEYDIGYLFGK